MPTTRSRGLLKSLWPFIRWYPIPFAVLFVLGLIGSLAEGVGVSLFVPFIRNVNEATYQTQTGVWFVDTLTGLFDGMTPETRLKVIAGAIFGSVLLRTSVGYAQSALFLWLDNRIGHRLRGTLFQRLLTVTFRYFETRPTGRLINVLSTESWRTTTALSVLVSLVTDLCMLAVYVTLMLLLSWKLTLGALAAMGAVSLGVRWMTRRTRSMGREVTRSNEALATRMLEGIEGMKVIRLFGREADERKRFDTASWTVSRALIRLGLLSNAVGPVYQLASAAVIVLLLYVAAQNPAHLPSMLVFLFVLYRLQPRIKNLDGARVRLRALTSAVDSVQDLLDPSNKPFVSHGGTAVPALREGIRLHDVSFRYDAGDAPALDRVSLTIPAGRTVALVGPSGAGKSTLVKLLLRLYDPTDGQVTVDGIPLRELDLPAWRARTAIVSQDVFLFDASVADNIAYGRPGAPRDAIEDAAWKADAHRFIQALPQGYDTRVGADGVQLSGGQRQRITLARAILRDPDLLILDEATNALDSISEHLIQQALHQLARTRTVVVIAHRLATVRQADCIAVLEDGRVVETGTFETLCAQDGLFARMVHLQNMEVAHVPDS